MSAPTPEQRVERRWPVAHLRDMTEQVGLQCWGCGHTLKLAGTDPQGWIEVLCLDPGCPANAIAGVKPKQPRRLPMPTDPRPEPEGGA